MLLKLGGAFESVIPGGLCLSNSAVHLNLWNGSKKHLVSTCGRIGYCRFGVRVACGPCPYNYRFRIRVAGRSHPSNYRFKVRVAGHSLPSNYRFRIRMAGRPPPSNYRSRIRAAGSSHASTCRFRVMPGISRGVCLSNSAVYLNLRSDANFACQTWQCI